MSWSEARLHGWLARQARPRGLSGDPMHDAALLGRLAGRPVLCTDQVIEGVHFEARTPPARVGRKAADRALSDLAATAARPVALLCALRAPPATSEAWIRAALRALRARAREFGADLVGGDLAQAPGPRALAITALGERAGRGVGPSRARARVGDLVFATGPTGGSLLGRHLAIEPRVAEGQWLLRRGAHALMDVSDGLLLDLWRLARRSRVRIRVLDIPLHADALRAARQSGRPAWQHAASDGEDHELLACVPPARVERLLAEAPRACAELRFLGRVERGRGLLVHAPDGRRLRFAARAPGGWIHGVRP